MITAIIFMKGGIAVKVLVVMDSFKGSATSMDCGQAVSKGIMNVYPKADIVTIPLADGGEGTVDALIGATGGEQIEVLVTGPLGEKVNAVYGILGDGKTAVIEVAAACGLPLIRDDSLNPLLTTTYGVGELIKDAITRGCREFVIGLGGSSTNDAGIGMLQALGFKFLDSNLQEVGFGGGELGKIQAIDMDSRNEELKKCSFQIACDVSNILYGKEGAAYVFGPQKGATDEMVLQLDHGLKHFSDVVSKETGLELHNINGGGAAGGLGAAFYGFLNGKLQSGIDLMLEKIGIQEQLTDVDIVITGEGRLDGQTSMGKVPLGIGKVAGKYQIPVIAIAGSVTDDAAVLHEQGISSFFSILQSPMALDEAMDSSRTLRNIEHTAEQVFRLIRKMRRE